MPKYGLCIKQRHYFLFLNGLFSWIPLLGRQVLCESRKYGELAYFYYYFWQVFHLSYSLLHFSLLVDSISISGFWFLALVLLKTQVQIWSLLRSYNTMDRLAEYCDLVLNMNLVYNMNRWVPSTEEAWMSLYSFPFSIKSTLKLFQLLIVDYLKQFIICKASIQFEFDVILLTFLLLQKNSDHRVHKTQQFRRDLSHSFSTTFRTLLKSPITSQWPSISGLWSYNTCHISSL